MADLKPCPKCGSPGEVWQSSVFPDCEIPWSATCTRDGCTIGPSFHATQAEAGTEWDYQPRADRLTAIVAAAMLIPLCQGACGGDDEGEMCPACLLRLALDAPEVPSG